MRVRHPIARRDDGVVDDAVDVDGTLVSVAEDGTFAVPDDADDELARFADRYDVDPEALRVADTCAAVKQDGDVCGRERPCRYHDDDDS